MLTQTVAAAIGAITFTGIRRENARIVIILESKRHPRNQESKKNRQWKTYSLKKKKKISIVYHRMEWFGRWERRPNRKGKQGAPLPF